MHTTMRYAHVGDREVEAAAERVGQAIHTAMGGTTIAAPEPEGPETAARKGTAAAD